MSWQGGGGNPAQRPGLLVRRAPGSAQASCRRHFESLSPFPVRAKRGQASSIELKATLRMPSAMRAVTTACERPMTRDSRGAGIAVFVAQESRFTRRVTRGLRGARIARKVARESPERRPATRDSRGARIARKVARDSRFMRRKTRRARR